MAERCSWAKSQILMEYHDTQWGVPLHDDNRLFEFLILDAFQAGLTWELILKRRSGLRYAFANFSPDVVAAFTENDISTLLNDPNIIRNQAKVRAAVTNARAFLKIRDELGSFDQFIWQFVDGKTIQNRWADSKEIPAVSDESVQMSKTLKQRGFNFVGPTICYAFMQATGMVNDHLVSCFRYSL